MEPNSVGSACEQPQGNIKMLGSGCRYDGGVIVFCRIYIGAVVEQNFDYAEVPVLGCCYDRRL